MMGEDIWKEIEELVQEFQKLGISQSVNYIQFYYHLFPAKIFKEDRADYILSLKQSQDEEVNQPFLAFMAMQLKKSLSIEIEKYHASRKKGFSLMF
jgi:hypothetical protein